MLNKNLLKKMVGEMSITTLCEMLAEYASNITSTEEGSDQMMELLGSIDIVVSELKGRSAKPKKPKKPEKPESNNASSNLPRLHQHGGDNE